jgi:undecaprenyl-diphosphatase
VAGAIFALALLLALVGAGERSGRLSNWQALVLGVVQGATELLPISSSGHLILVPWLADWRYLETHESFNKTFDVALHLGTLAAVAAYFRADIVRYVTAWLGSLRRRTIAGPDERIAWTVFAATIPAGLAGALGESVIEEKLGEPWQIAILLAVFGIVLWLADRLPQRRSLEGLGVRAGLAVGVAQVLALVPGVSRSGVTITAGRLAQLDRDAAARFSFLLAVPVILGAVLYKGAKDVVLDPLPAGWVGPFVVGTLAAAAVGLVVIDLLLGYVRRHDYSPFVVYRLAVAAFVLILIAAGARDATF